MRDNTDETMAIYYKYIKISANATLSFIIVLFPLYITSSPSHDLFRPSGPSSSEICWVRWSSDKLVRSNGVCELT
jgi:hypothetical protein